jgi:adenosylhomocysteine nucleosidase
MAQCLRFGYYPCVRTEDAGLPDSRRRGILGIVFALELEARGFRRVMSHAQRAQVPVPGQSAWRVGGAEVIMEIGGIGRECARQAADRLISQGAKWIASAGFAAALDEKARAGDVVVADSVSHLGSPESALQCSPSLSAAIPPSGRLGYSVWRSDFVTSDSMILRAATKRDIYAQTRAATLDMESCAVGEVCSGRDVPFIVVKGISDTADRDLPDEVETLANAAGWVDRAGFLLSRPHLWGDLWRLRKNALTASDNLGDVLGTMLLRLFA